MGKLNLSELVARSQQSEQDKFRVVYLKIDRENTIEARKKDLRAVEKVLDMEVTDTHGRNRQAAMLIYDHCPVLREKELQQAYQCVEPVDVVEKVFQSNMGLMQQAAAKIMQLYGLSEENAEEESALEQVKN